MEASMRMRWLIYGAVLAGSTAWGKGAAASGLQVSGEVRSKAAGAAATGAAAAPVEVERMRKQLADWAGMGRYAAENATLPAPAKGVRRVVFYGDSITDAWGRRPDTGTFFPGKPYVNRGISGQTTPQMLVRFEQDVVRLRPAVVVILAGTNDVAGNTGPETPQMIEDNFRAMAAIAKANGIKVVLASITPAYAYPWKPEVKPVAEIGELNAWMKQICASEGMVYLDYFTALADERGGMREGTSFDGVHPNAAGYAVMGPLAERAIAEALGR